MNIRHPLLAAAIAPLLAPLSPAPLEAALSVTECAAAPHRAGVATYQLGSAGSPGRYVLYVPRSYDGTRPFPAILDFHGSGSNPEQELALSGMDSVAERRGYLVLLPFARVPMPTGGHTWNIPRADDGPDDVRLVEEVLEDAARRVCIAPGRVYLTGFSGGARLASRVACAMADRVAAVALVGGIRRPEDCGGVPVPVLAFHGTEDPINPYDGGGPEYWGYGVDTAIRGWAEHNACRPVPLDTARSPRVLERAYPECRDDAAVVLFRVVGAGHRWPGSRLELPEDRFGKGTDEIDATRVIADFFDAHAG